jgi:mono/diheme cytochrome c family protein
MRNPRLIASVVAASFLSSAVALADADPKIQRLWKAQCAACHGQAGKGDTDKGKQLKVNDMSAAAFQAKKDEDFKKALADGVKWEAGDMPAFKELTPDQVTGLIGLIRTFKK